MLDRCVGAKKALQNAQNDGDGDVDPPSYVDGDEDGDVDGDADGDVDAPSDVDGDADAPRSSFDI